MLDKLPPTTTIPKKGYLCDLKLQSTTAISKKCYYCDSELPSKTIIGKASYPCAPEMAPKTTIPKKPYPCDPEKFYTTGELAKILKLTTSWFEHHRRQRDGIPFVRLGTRTVRYAGQAVNSWYESQMVHTPSTSSIGGGHGK